MKHIVKALVFILIFSACNTKPVSEKESKKKADAPFMWENATVYFLLADRFNNADTINDVNFGRMPDGAYLRNFMGGDIKGITQKIKEGYFTELGVTALWVNPVVEQIKGAVDEGTGKTYGYHGYWTRDWTALDPNFGTMDDLREMVEAAHAKGIRVLLDAVANHTGPVTSKDSKWPEDWVRTEPTCTYENWETTVKCTLVENLPDILTESDEEVELPQFLLDKWKEEGRLEQETAELDEFFESTGYPRAPRYYIIKWLVDYIKEFGIDGFRVDTAKHTEAGVWADLYAEAVKAFEDWKKENPEKKLDDNDFYMVGEVYFYSIYNGKNYPYSGDTTVDFYSNGFKSLINFSLKSEINEKSLDEIYTSYSNMLHGELAGKSVLNYMSSHDDSSPFDKLREKPFETANDLLLAPGAAQIYYGDETARLLQAKGAEGDANLRTFMNWDELANDIERNGYTITAVRNHWAKLGKFRKQHPALGAGVHKKLADKPYTFQRTLELKDYEDKVVVAMDSVKHADVSSAFSDGEQVMNYYTGEIVTVANGNAVFEIPSPLLLIGK